jgi:hypothetical protein
MEVCTTRYNYGRFLTPSHFTTQHCAIAYGHVGYETL